MKNKICKLCTKEFSKNKKECNRDWNTRKFCSAECYNLNRTNGPKSKFCVICSKEYFRILLIKNSQWEQSKVCSIGCRKIYLKQINAGFKKGHKSFLNTEFTRFKKGQSAYNKDKKGLQVAWNKNLTSEDTPSIRSGERHRNWKGGVSKLRDQIKVTYHYKKWRLDVFIRDKYTCQNCGQIGGELSAHHKKSFSLIIFENNIKTVEQAKLCFELWDISNGETLCIECHKKTDSYLRKLKT